MKNLKTDYIDLYYLHRLDAATPIEETVEALSELVQEGKIKYIGLSEVGTETIKKAHAIHPLTAVLEAKRMLVESELTIKEIAYNLQFNDHSYFSRFFKKIVALLQKNIRSIINYVNNESFETHN